VEYAEPLSRPFPWRAATLVAAALATLELVALIVVGALVLARPIHHSATTKAAAAAVFRTPLTHVHRVKVTPHALRPRTHVSVLILNGNGVHGAAAREAAKLRGFGYRISDSRNAQRHDYARSMVMYLPGYAREGHRIARDAGIRLVSPVDGLKPTRSQIVIVLGR
jgi:hypothetical protein